MEGDGDGGGMVMEGDGGGEGGMVMEGDGDGWGRW